MSIRLVVLSLLFVVSCSRDGIKFSDRFYFPNKFKGISISKFIIEENKFPVEEDVPNDKNYTMTNQDELHALYKSLCSKTKLPTSTINAAGLSYQLNYECTFSDNISLRYQGEIKFNKERTYLRIYFPDDISFQGDPQIYIRLESVLSEDTLKALRNEFLEGEDPPVFKARK